MQDISLQNFEADLITESAQQPVLLDIWAPWCGPCKSLGPVLEKLETAYAGRFKLAKLNSDGQPVDGFVGALPESEVRAFLDKHVPSADEAAAEEDVEEAQALLAEGDTDSAVEKLQEAVAVNPANDAARYDYLRALLGAGRIEEARRAYDPVASKMMLDARLTAAGHWLAASERASAARSPSDLQAAIAANKRDFDARFELAQTHFAAQRFTDAMDELLEIVMRDKAWHDELARKTYVAILELMAKPAPKPETAAPAGKVEIAGKAVVAASDPVIDSYRRKLSMALF
jgi:putative thioredoxin